MQERYKMPMLHSPEGKGAITLGVGESHGKTQPAPSPLVPCPSCTGPIFVRQDQTIVSHYNGDGVRCSANETKYEPTHRPDCSSNDPSCFNQAACDCAPKPGRWARLGQGLFGGSR